MPFQMCFSFCLVSSAPSVTQHICNELALCQGQKQYHFLKGSQNNLNEIENTQKKEMSGRSKKIGMRYSLSVFPCDQYNVHQKFETTQFLIPLELCKACRVLSTIVTKNGKSVCVSVFVCLYLLLFLSVCVCDCVRVFVFACVSVCLFLCFCEFDVMG